MNYSFDMDITYSCNLTCKWCNHLCGTSYTPKDDHMSIPQIQRYIEIIEELPDQTFDLTLMGGEPSLHPQFLEILTLLQPLRKRSAYPIIIYSNGVGKQVQDSLDQARSQFTTRTWIKSHGTTRPEMKDSTIDYYIIITKLDCPMYAEQVHLPIFRAIKDYNFNFSPIAQSNSCGSPGKCTGSISLTPYGIFSCSAGYPLIIERVFGIDVGLDHIPTEADRQFQAQKLCEYCAFPCSALFDKQVYAPVYPFTRVRVGGATVSPTYQDALTQTPNVPRRVFEQ